MKDKYYILLTNDSSSLNSVNEPIYDALAYVRDHNQEHKNVPIFVLPTTMSVVRNKFTIYSNISRILTKEMMRSIVESIKSQYIYEITTEDCEVLKVIDTHLILSPGNWIINAEEETTSGERWSAPVSFIRQMITEIKAKEEVFLDVRFIIGVMKGGEGFETVSKGLVIPSESDVGREVSKFTSGYIDSNEWRHHPDYLGIMSKQTILDENDLQEKGTEYGELFGKDTGSLLEATYSLFPVDASKLN